MNRLTKRTIDALKPVRRRDTALIIAADQVAAEIARLLDGGELRSVRKIKQARTLAMLRAVA